MRTPAALSALMIVPLLGGCIAAALPVVAAGVMARDELRGRKMPERHEAEVAQAVAGPVVSSEGAGGRTPMTVVLRADEDALPPTGPGDYAPFARFATDLQRQREAGEAITSAVLVRNFAIERPDYVECGAQPPAVIVDLDPANGGPDPQLFVAAPDKIINPSLGLAARLADLREAGVAILWLTDHPADVVPAIADTLRATGLDPENADRIHAAQPGGGRKQERRINLASAWCILAIAGDAKSDAEEAYDYLRSPDAALMIDQRWQDGWFLVPPPLVAFSTPQAPSQVDAMTPTETSE
jgi:hypothetical protein